MIHSAKSIVLFNRNIFIILIIIIANNPIIRNTPNPLRFILVLAPIKDSIPNNIAVAKNIQIILSNSYNINIDEKVRPVRAV